MKPDETRTNLCYRFALRPFILLMTAVLLFNQSCAKPSPEENFASILSTVDSYIEAGNAKKAAKLLIRLQKSAVSSRNWLSIIKRQVRLQLTDDALLSTSEALARQPANEELSAVKAWLLDEKGLHTDAVSFFPLLNDSQYAFIAAKIGISQALDSSLAVQQPEWWESGWRAVGSVSLLRNAAAVSAFAGDFSAALDYARQVFERDQSYQSRVDAACLALDASVPEAAIALLSPVRDSSRSDSVPLLLADAYLFTGRIPEAREAWASLLARGDLSLPLPLYNYAFSDPDPVYRKNALEKCLSRFPGYYPAVALYVRSAAGPSDGLSFDKLEKELDNAGYSTLRMEEKRRTAPVSQEAALERLDAARRNAAGEDVVIIELERLRFLEIMRDSSAFAGPELWKLLELYPASSELQEYAAAYFARTGDYDTAFSFFRKENAAVNTLFEGVRLASLGELDEAEAVFAAFAGEKKSEWIALANLGLIEEKKRAYADAIEKLSLAAERAPEDRISSLLHYETARILANTRNPARAISVLGYSLQLDPENYRAQQLKRQLEAIQ